MEINDDFYMKLAIDEAWKFQLLTYPNPAVGAVVLKNGTLLSIEAHKEAGLPHAEVNALKAAYLKVYPKSELQYLNDSFEIHKFLKNNHNDFFEDCEIFVTLEPCNHTGKTPACSELMEFLNLKRVVVGSIDPNSNATGGIERLRKAGIEVNTGICKQECEDLLYPFMKWLNGGFSFFKLATRLNGTITGGYISSKETLEYVHNIRSKLELLAISGNTVRTDRPTLDCRYVNKQAPNVLIYSNSSKDEFDKEIPLFNILNRSVIVSNDKNKIFNSKNVMIEGGYSLLEILKDDIDMLLLLVSPTLKNSNDSTIEYLIDEKYRILHQYYNGNESVIFLTRNI